MKPGWEVKALGEVATIINGGTPKSEISAYWDGDVDWLTPKDMGRLDGHLVHVTPRRITREGLAKCSARQVPAQSVIMSTRAPIGHLAINTVPMAFNQGCRGMVPGDKLDTKFLFYVLSANVQALDDLGTGTTFKELSAGCLKSFPFPLPPLDEQKRIVAILDAAFDGLSRARAHTETNLQNARELFLRSIECEFELLAETHERQTVGEIAAIKGGKRLPKGEKTVATQTPFPYISIKDFNDQGSVDIAGIDYLLPATRDAIKNYIISSDDLYISIAGTIGKTGIVPPELDGANLTENAARMVFKEAVNNEYVYFFTLSADFQDQAGLNTRTAAQPKLALERLKTISVPIVPLIEQIEMAGKFRSLRDQTQQIEAHYRAKLADLDALRQALLQKAFAGELT